MSKHPILWFYILAFGIAWLGWIPAALGSQGVTPFNQPYFQPLIILPALSPMLAAVVVTRAAYGKIQVGELFKPLVQWRINLGWYLVAVLAPIVLLLSGQSLTKWLGFAAAQPALQGEILPLAISAFVLSLFSNPWEEVGWRGFALPHLQKRYTALAATLIVGVLWGLWHMPLFFWKGNPMAEYPFLPWYIGIVSSAFLYTWLYNSTQGSLLPVTLFHITLNTFGAVIQGVSTIALAILYVLVAIVLVIAFGGNNLARWERVQAG